MKEPDPKARTGRLHWQGSYDAENFRNLTASGCRCCRNTSTGRSIIYHDQSHVQALKKSLPSSSTKKRVLAADKEANGERGLCCIELTPRNRPVEFVYCINRFRRNTIERSKLQSLEWYWNMRKGSLNLDSRYNIMRLSRALRYMFDMHYWCLVPETQYVDKYYNSLVHGESKAHRRDFPQIPNGVFNYRLFASKENMENIVITRDELGQIREPGGTCRPEDYSLHVFPFKDLIIRSHVHPKFAIYEAGRKLFNDFIGFEILDRDEEDKELFVRLMDIYEAWSQPLPPEHRTDPTYNGDKWEAEAGFCSDNETRQENASP